MNINIPVCQIIGPAAAESAGPVPTPVGQRRSTTLYTMAFSWAGIYIFWGLLPANGILPPVEFTVRPSLAFSHYNWQPYCTALSSGR